MDDVIKLEFDGNFKEQMMEAAYNQTGVVFYSYNPVDQTLTPSSAPVHVELDGSDIARQINQQVPISFGNVQTPQILLASQANVSAPVQGNGYPHEVQNPPVQLPKPVKKVRTADGERVPCTECGKTFSCNANLRDHLRLHTGERPFKCSECGLLFAQRSNWRLHKRVHTGERPYMCGICGKTFSRSSHLPGHARIHTGERPFQCKECQQAFASAQALKNHTRIHTGEKPFVCEICNTSFTHSSSLSSHKKRCTGQKKRRGRPIGASKVYKKKSTARPRGRPRKRGRRGRKKNFIETPKVEVDVLINEGGTVKLENELENNSVEGAILEITALPVHNDNNNINTEEDYVEPNASEGVEILPNSNSDKNMPECLDSDSNSQIDLRQEAAVTMANLQQGVISASSAKSDPIDVDSITL